MSSEKPKEFKIEWVNTKLDLPQEHLDIWSESLMAVREGIANERSGEIEKAVEELLWFATLEQRYKLHQRILKIIRGD